MNSGDSLVVFPNESEIQSSVCVCELPVLDEDFVSCGSCDNFYHRRCVRPGSHLSGKLPEADGVGRGDDGGPGLVECDGDWMCDTCVQLLSFEDELDRDMTSSNSDKVSNEEPGMPGPSGIRPTTSKPSETTSSDKPSTRKRLKVYRPASAIAKEAVLEGKVQRVQDIIVDVENHKDFQSKHGYGQDIINLSNSIMKHVDEPLFETFCEELISNLWDVVTAGDKLPVGPSSVHEMWRCFHRYRMSENLLCKWDTFLTQFNIRCKHIVEQLLLQHILRMLLLILTKKRQEVDEGDIATPQVNLTNHDEQVLRYVSGYVPSKLIRKYKSQKSETAQEYAHLLSSWKQDDVTTPSFLNYTNIWINIQDRGGLFHVNDDVFRLFRCMEKSTQQFLQLGKLGTMKKTNLKAALSSQLLQDKHVRKMWGIAIEGRSGKIEWESLLISIINYWTKIRLYAFVKIYMELQKKKAVVSKRGEKGLRKELNRS